MFKKILGDMQNKQKFGWNMEIRIYLPWLKVNIFATGVKLTALIQ